MENFPGNSHNLQSEKKQLIPGKPEKEPIEKVVTVDAIQRKRSLGYRFKSIFFRGEFKSAARYVLTDVLLPSLKNLVVDAGTEGLKRSVYGDSYRRTRPELGRTSRFSYNTPVDRGYRPRMLPDQPPYVTPRRQQDVGELILVSRSEAETVVERLGDIIDKYDVASLADLYDLVGLPSTHVDNKWGWSNLAYAHIRQIREGYLIDLPPVEPLNI
jgi:hypothetical protein